MRGDPTNVDLTLAVLCIIWPKGEQMTLPDLADLCGVHRSVIYNIEMRAKRKLQKAIAPRIHDLLPD